MTPSVEVASKLARVLDETVEYLVGEHDLPEILKDPPRSTGGWPRVLASVEDRRRLRLHQ
jgi:hypothetical protein